MCGIAGYLRTGIRQEPDSVLEAMVGVLHHRGPDGAGIFQDQHAALGHRRLSIIDVAGGHQPLANEANNCWITYNGEIFNHAALRPALENAGHRYRTRCDTETIVHAYEERGADCVLDFRGMFAFAIWDQPRRRLFAARDRLGIKPFYYYWDGKLFAFASEIKGLLEHPDIRTEFNSEVLREYLVYGYVSGEDTLFRNIRKLMPGHRLQLTLTEHGADFKIDSYWDVPVASADTQRSEQSWIDECRMRLEETVQMRLMSDVPLGVFLSGGVDSSAIAALVKKMAPGPVKTFAVGYREAQYSELGFARQVAGHLGTDHHEVQVGMEEFFNALPTLIWHEDEPITWPSSVALHFVSKLASEQVKVVLTGEGSDELFGGYARYRTTIQNRGYMRGYQAVPRLLRDRVRSSIQTSKLLSAEMRRKLGHTVLGRSDSMESLYADNFYAAFTGEEVRRMAPSLGGGDPYSSFLRYWNSREGSSDLARMLYADQKTYLVELLMKQDQMSMSCSIESRVPFLDHTFVEFSTRVPDNLKIRNKEGKYILKRAVEHLLPRDIIYRTKMGFPTPMRSWLLSPQAEPLFATFADPDGLLANYIDLKEVYGLLDRHRRNAEDATDRLWRLLNLQIWGKTFLTAKKDRGMLLPAARM